MNKYTQARLHKTMPLLSYRACSCAAAELIADTTGPPVSAAASSSSFSKTAWFLLDAPNSAMTGNRAQKFATFKIRTDTTCRPAGQRMRRPLQNASDKRLALTPILSFLSSRRFFSPSYTKSRSLRPKASKRNQLLRESERLSPLSLSRSPDRPAIHSKSLALASLRPFAFANSN